MKNKIISWKKRIYIDFLKKLPVAYKTGSHSPYRICLMVSKKPVKDTIYRCHYLQFKLI